MIAAEDTGIDGPGGDGSMVRRLLMNDLPVFLTGVMVGLIAGLLLARLRRTEVLDASSVGSKMLLGAQQRERTTAGPDAKPGEKVEQRVETHLGPDGFRVTVDGQEYHRLEDIPDVGLRKAVRKDLVSAARTAEDPAIRADLEKELREAGIEPEGEG